MYGVIYKITNKLNDMIYIGQTTRSLKVRFREHAKAGCHLHNAIEKYGIDNFAIEVIEECKTKQELDEREIFWIAELKCRHPNGYNLNNGGSGNAGFLQTEETRSKKSAIMKGKKSRFFGKRHTEESKLKIGASMTGEKNHFYGKHHTDEVRVKISSIRRNSTPYKNLLIELDKRKLSYKALAKLLGRSIQNISNKMRDRRKFTARDIVKLVEIFGLPAEYLMAREDKIST